MAMKKPTTKKKAVKKDTPKKSDTAARTSVRRQMTAVILLAVAILLFSLAIIPGENLWTLMHNFMLGVFSYNAYILPPLLGFVSVMLASEKDPARISTRVWQFASFSVMLGSVLFTFTADSKTMDYFTAIGTCYVDAKAGYGGGAWGALLGYPIEYLFGDVPAKIVLILLVFVFLMLMTGTSVMALVRLLRKPVEKTREGIEQIIEYTAQRQEERRNAKIDIALDDEYKEAVEETESPAMTSSDKLKAFEAAASAMNDESVPVDEPDELPEVVAEEAAPDEEGAAPIDPDEIEQEIAEQQQEREVVYRYPPLTLLDDTSGAVMTRGVEAERRANGELLVSTLQDFGISTRLADIVSGPAVTRYELEPSAGVKISRITGLADDIALRLATTGVRIEAPIPNKAAVGIEVPNKARRTVGLRSLLDTAQFRGAKGKLTVALGQDIEGRAVLTDLAKMPHLLIAGTTGSGKSVCTNSMIQSVLFRANPDEVKLILIDPKKVEFGVYNGIPHLLVPVVTDPRKAAGALSWAVNEMLKRYQMFAEANVRDITGYNEWARSSGEYKPLPLILIMIDELADLMMAAANEVEDSICRLAQMARAAGMHMVIATQRPSVDVITGLIKANIPSRLALTVASAVDSRTILDTGGAEKLLGNGDMLFMPVGQSKPTRVQGCFVNNQEIERVIEFLKTQDKPQEYDQEIIAEIDKQAAAAGRASARDDDDADADDEYDEALPQVIEIAIDAGQISTSMVQRKMRFGYARAGRIIDQLEQRGIIGPSEGSKPRKVLITRQQWIEMNMNDDTQA